MQRSWAGEWLLQKDFFRIVCPKLLLGYQDMGKFLVCFLVKSGIP